MANPVGALRADLETNVAAFKQDMNAAADAVDKTTGKMRKAGAEANKQGAGFANFGKQLKGAFSIGAGVAVAAFIKDSLQGAIASEEMAATLKREFGAMGDSVENWASDTSKELGIVDDELKESAAKFGNLFEKVVPTQGAAADMSETMTRLAVDLAVFNRVPVAEATEKLQKGLAGSTRGLKEFGILITEQEVAQKAVSMGLARTTKEVSAQDRVLASYNLILEKTTNAQGAAAQGMQTTAGKLRAFEAGIDSLSDDLGAIFLPVLMEVVKWLDLYASGIRTILGDTDDFQRGIAVLQAQMTGKDVGQAVMAFNAAHAAIDDVGRAAATNGGVIEKEFDASAKTVAELNKEMRALTREAVAVNKEVSDFGIPDDPASTKPLTEASDAYVKLSDSIMESIAALKDKADRNQDESNQMALLQDALDRLTVKYDAAQKAAEDLFAAQGKLNDAKAGQAVQGINDSIDSLGRASGAMGTQSRGQEQLSSIERDLQKERMDAAVDLLGMEAARAEAIRTNDDTQVAALNQIIPRQQEYSDLLNQTSALQISQQEQLQASIEDWQQSTDQAVGNFFKDLRDTAGANGKEIAATLIQSISDEVLERKAKDLVEGVFGFLFGDQGKKQDVQTINAQRLNVADSGGLGDMGNAITGVFGGGGENSDGGFFGGVTKAVGDFFGGFFADGGSLAPGQWGIAGEGGHPEILRGGTHGMSIEPMDTMGGGPSTQNFYFPNANVDGFMSSRRQVAQMARRQLSR